MRRPGPLHDLPLGLFLPPTHNLSHSSSRPSKRPLSPASPSLLTPTKRRILNQEEMLSSGHPKSPLSRDSKVVSSGQYADLLSSSASPARVLDFGQPKDGLAHGRNGTPRGDNTSAHITPRRPITRSMSKHLSMLQMSDNGPSHHICKETDDVSDQSFPTTRHDPSLIYVSRELPPPLDPQSVHYPGFEVYRDAYIIIASPLDDSDIESNKDEQKENIPCRRKSRKASSSSKASSQLLAAQTEDPCKTAKSKPTSSSSKKIFGMCNNLTSPTSSSHRLGFALHVTSPLSEGARFNGSRMERKRRLMEEVDDITSSIDEEGETGDALY